MLGAVILWGLCHRKLFGITEKYSMLTQYSGGCRISRRGGRGPRRGAWTTEAVTFQKFCMSKRKNLDPWGACTGHAPSKSVNAVGDTCTVYDFQSRLQFSYLNC